VLVEDVRGHVGSHVVSWHVGGGELEKAVETGRYAGEEILGTIYEAGKMDKIRHRRRGEKHMIRYKGEKSANSQVKDLKTSFGDGIGCAVEGRRKMYERVKTEDGRP
jgi:protoporphyrinogen oxidase